MHLLERIFSVKNKGKHKVWTILGIKLKFRRKIKSQSLNICINTYFARTNISGLEFYYDKNSNTYSFVDYGGHGLRNMSTIRMLSIAMCRVKNKLKKSFKVKILTGDFVPEVENEIWAYSRFKNIQKDVELIPDFFFDSWKEIGCDIFDEWTKKIVENSKKAPEFDMLFWSGALDMNIPARNKFYELAQKNDKFECQPIIWQRNNWIPNKEIRNNRKITLVEHPKYKYLIDLPCAGYSGRFKALLFSGRPVFKVEDRFEEFFYKDLKPFVHYIPVKNDLSDLVEKYEWAENNYTAALEIAKNAQEYAIQFLNFENAIQYLEKLIVKIGR